MCRLRQARNSQRLGFRPISAKKRNGASQGESPLNTIPTEAVPRRSIIRKRTINNVIRPTNKRSNTCCLTLRTITLTCLTSGGEKSELEIIKWDAQKSFKEKVELQHKDQPTAANNYTPAEQLLFVKDRSHVIWTEVATRPSAMDWELWLQPLPGQMAMRSRKNFLPKLSFFPTPGSDKLELVRSVMVLDVNLTCVLLTCQSRRWIWVSY